MMDASSQWSAVSQRIVMMLIDVSMTNAREWRSTGGPEASLDPLSPKRQAMGVNE